MKKTTQNGSANATNASRKRYKPIVPRNKHASAGLEGEVEGRRERAFDCAATHAWA